MAKIGIVTFHRAHNFGALLQCFALQETLRSLNHDVFVIDYSCKAIEEVYSNGIPKIKNRGFVGAAKAIIVSCLKGYREYVRYNKFDDFIINNLNLSSRISDGNNDLLNSFDVIIFGSDQIWNGELTKNDSFYFGDFKYHGKKISYGASAGKCENKIAAYYNLLSDFYSLGVREESLRQSLNSVRLLNSEINIDPTLLLSSNQWIDLLKIPKNKSNIKKYVLAYPLREREGTMTIAKDISSELNFKICEIGARVMLGYYPNRLEKIGPVDFIKQIYYSEIVITNSFHGTVFAIIFNKNFYTVAVNDGEDGRVINLLKSLNLENRLVRIGEKISFEPIDYTAVNNILYKLRINSLDFLTKAINK